jgi:hypothetical protein
MYFAVGLRAGIVCLLGMIFAIDDSETGLVWGNGLAVNFEY